MKKEELKHKNIQKVILENMNSTIPVYGMIVHESHDLTPYTRVEYVGKNKDYRPLKADLLHGTTDYGDWENWSWLADNIPVMCDWEGNIDYALSPEDYTRINKTGEPSDIFNVDYPGNAMAVIRKIYTCTYCLGHDRYVYFCDKQLSEEFQPIGFNVRGIIRDYMLIPMFYGSKDEKGRLRSLAGQWSAGTATGHHTQNRDGMDMDTAAQHLAVQTSSPDSLFFGGALVNVLTDIAVLLTKTTDSQTAFGTGMCSCFTSDDDHKGHWGTQKNPVLNRQFGGGTDGKTFSNIFHSSVLGSNMLWQRDPYMLLVYGKIMVSPDYTFDLTGESYIDTGRSLEKSNYYAAFDVVSGYGFIPCTDIIGSETEGYCDHMYANPAVVSVSSRFGCCRSGMKAGLFARSLNHSGFNRKGLLENQKPLDTAEELDESFSWWWNFGCSLMVPGKGIF